jgi:hypothetical protein
LPAILASQLRFLGLKLLPNGKRLRMYNITLSKGAKLADCRGDRATLIELYRAGKLGPSSVPSSPSPKPGKPTKPRVRRRS